VGGSVFIILLNGWLVDLDALRGNNSTNLDIIRRGY
jgi:hypothetical protein